MADKSVGEQIIEMLNNTEKLIDLCIEDRELNEVRKSVVKAKYDMEQLLNKRNDDKDISLCKKCWCMTHAIDGKCGKCGARKEDNNE